MAVRLFRPLIQTGRAFAVSRQKAAIIQPHTFAAFHASTARFNENIINIQDVDDFTDRVVKSSVPVIIDFHAGWCGPCKILGPRLESLVGEMDGKVILAKVDIDDNSELAIDHGVQAVPTVIGMKGGKAVDQFVGVKDSDQLNSFVKKLVGE